MFPHHLERVMNFKALYPVLFLAAFWPAAARADRACNYTNQVIWAAHAEWSGYETGWQTFGWWTIQPSHCSGETRNDRYTYVAYQTDGRRTPPRQYDKRPSKKFCVSTQGFSFNFADNPKDCAQYGGRMETFLNYGLDTETIY